ncbi:MAG: hypothetical protein WC836_13715 [Desulfobacula sp.]
MHKNYSALSVWGQKLCDKAMESIMGREVLPLYTGFEHTRPAKKINLSEFVRMVQDPRIGPKDNTTPALTPFDGDGKTKDIAQVSLYYALLVDHDHDNIDADGIRAKYGRYEMAYVAWTTSSHQKGGKGNRWKVLIPFSEPIGFALWLEIARGAALMTGADLAQARSQQVFFGPNKQTPDAPYESILRLDRPFVDPVEFQPYVSDCLIAYSKEQETQQSKAEAAVPKPRSLNGFDGDIIQKIIQAYRMDEVLQGAGYILKGKKYLSPQSESGDPGVIILTRDGKEAVYSHHGPSDPLSSLNHGGHALDILDALTILRYGGDLSKAIRELAPQVDPEGQKQRQREYAENRSTAAADFSEFKTPDGQVNGFTLRCFTMSGGSKAMEEKMLNDTYIMGRVAIMGQFTIIFAQYNVGKTLMALYFIIEAIKNDLVKGDDVYYINADDTFKGLVYKLKIAEKWGFHMLAPGHGPEGKEFKADQLPAYLQLMIQSGTAHSSIIILDTAKKFSDLMSKDRSSKFNEHIRQFISHGGTVIALAHVNKHRDENKKVIYEGTSDLVSDCDCAYTLDTVTEDSENFRTVKFENIKCRGDVATEAFYKYDFTSGLSYYERLDSVTPIDEDEREKAELKHRLDVQLHKNKVMVDAITDCINDGITKKTDLIKEAAERSGISKFKISKALADHTGSEVSKNQFWFIEVGEHNAKNYRLSYGVKS